MFPLTTCPGLRASPRRCSAGGNCLLVAKRQNLVSCVEVMQATVAFAGCFSNSKCGEPAFQREIQIQGGLMSTQVVFCVSTGSPRQRRMSLSLRCQLCQLCRLCLCRRCRLLHASEEINRKRGGGDEIFTGDIVIIPFSKATSSRPTERRANQGRPCSYFL